MEQAVSSISGEKRAESTRLGQVVVRGLTGGAVGALLNIGVFLIAQNALNIEMAVPVGPNGPAAPLDPLQVGLISLLPGLVAGLVFWGISRAWAQNARRIFTALSVALLLLSFIPVFGSPGIAASVRPVLALMHPISAAAIVGALLRKK